MACPPDIGQGVVLKFYWTEGGVYGKETLYAGANSWDEETGSDPFFLYS